VLKKFDAVVLAGGAEQPRDLPIRAANSGVHFAMELLPQQNKRVAGEGADLPRPGADQASGKHVVVIGGGDTGSDCIGTSNRQGAAIGHPARNHAAPPDQENKLLTWPDWPLKLRTSSSHDEGCQRDWAFEIKADLVLLAMGFTSPLQQVLDAFGVEKDPRGNAKAVTDGVGCYKTSVDKVFAAGDMRRGQSLVVWAIREGRQAARAVDEYLMGSSVLPR
jgi:glutamate synthase (NADPH) small chain